MAQVAGHEQHIVVTVCVARHARVRQAVLRPQHRHVQVAVLVLQWRRQAQVATLGRRALHLGVRNTRLNCECHMPQRLSVVLQTERLDATEWAAWRIVKLMERCSDGVIHRAAEDRSVVARDTINFGFFCSFVLLERVSSSSFAFCS
jgi:hypothetical protein